MESDLQNEIKRTVGTYPQVRMFRNNVGMATDASGRRIKYGLINGSADLIGWETVTITEAMVGTKIARFLSVEVKTPKGRVRPEQQVWMDVVNRCGGKAIIARSVDDVRAALV